MRNHEAVNYRLRPAKGTERKMLCEVMRRLSLFGPIENYSYIGFGSIYFTDYLLFHRLLGIGEMHSIEQDIDSDEVDEFTQNRYEFNKPYSCIDIHFGTATEQLPNMPWSKKKAIVWLDYIKGLKNDFIQDLRTSINKAQPGSLILITVNVEADRMPRIQGKPYSPEKEQEYRYQQLLRRINPKYLPGGTDTSKLATPDLVKIYHTIMTGVVNDTINKRCGLFKEDDKIIPQQVVNIQYTDGPTMLTLGWILVSKKDQDSFDKARFTDLSFYRSDAQPFKISIPNLTIKEVNWLDSVIHGVQIDDDENITYGTRVGISPALDPDDIKLYKQIYRYFPTFAEAIL